MLHGGFRLGVAGVALSEEADGDSLLDQADLAYFVQARLRRVKYITLVNLLSAKDIFVDRSRRKIACCRQTGIDRAARPIDCPSSAIACCFPNTSPRETNRWRSRLT